MGYLYRCKYDTYIPAIDGSTNHTPAVHNFVVAAKKAAAGKPRPRSPVLRRLGAQLRRLRLERDLSQMALAELARLNHKHIGNIELGKVDAGADALIRLARALAVPVGELFETITPANTTAYRVSPADLEEIKGSLGVLTAVIDRLRARQPRALAARAHRQPGR